jgi:hypothetical protein
MNKIIHPIEPEELMAYLDGELTTGRATTTAAHLAECAECQGLVAELRSVSQNLKTWKVEPWEAATTSAIETALAENRPLSRTVPTNYSSWHYSSWRGFLNQHSWAVASAGGLAIVFLVIFSTVSLQRGRGSFRQVASNMADRELVQFVGGGSGAGTAPRSPAPPPSPQSGGGKSSSLAQLYSGDHDRLALSSSGYSEETAQKRLREQQSEIASNLETHTAEGVPVSSGPMIIRTAQLTLVTKEFDKARANLEAILKRHRGYVGELNAGGSTGSGRTLTATLRVPADQLDATLTEVKTLGRVESESQGGQDVTSQYVDLQARLGNARNTEQRLTDLLRNRTGKLSDVLAVEQELGRVRGEIEQMEAERKNMAKQVSYATLNATITEDYKAELQVVPPSTFTRISNAAVEGYRGMVDGIVGLVLFLLSVGPSLLLWGAILFFPARLAWRRLRRRLAS